MNEKTQANREAWNALAKPHYENYHIHKLLSGEPLLSELIRTEVGDVTGKSLIHLLCHIGTDTLSWGLLGARVTGVDISPEAVGYAQKIAATLNLEAGFIISDVMDLPSRDLGTYDIAFASTGVLCWIPDIDQFAASVRRLLKPGGFFYIHDGHPFRNALEKNEQGDDVVKNNYFNAVPSEYETFPDYSVKDLLIPAKSYEWDWTMGQIVTAFCKTGMRIEFLHEYPQFFYSGYTGFDVETDKSELYPCTFSLKAVVE